MGWLGAKGPASGRVSRAGRPGASSNFQDQGADGDEDAGAANGLQVEGLSNGDFLISILILLDQLSMF